MVDSPTSGLGKMLTAVHRKNQRNNPQTPVLGQMLVKEAIRLRRGIGEPW
jgi:hypothetical protein